MTDLIFRDVRRGHDPDLADVLRIEEPAGTPDEYVYGQESYDGGKTWVRFSAWLPLLRVHLAMDQDARWARAAYAMSDHPNMGGDWSAIRDSSRETILALDAMAARFLPDDAFFRRLGLEPWTEPCRYCGARVHPQRLPDGSTRIPSHEANTRPGWPKSTCAGEIRP